MRSRRAARPWLNCAGGVQTGVPAGQTQRRYAYAVVDAVPLDGVASRHVL
eukprot:CAMPEP_0171257478 /NCGR_PEP_ID=MMETSP0790-20130122/53867_1 /TAXON_ID=2925 /ORGANISM="Alexandrium catenella, Strain OF101" /LENGTH=49 /DNA_ID= /DNA_START= /DNA_END= /DNA_ORIENTATION=